MASRPGITTVCFECFGRGRDNRALWKPCPVCHGDAKIKPRMIYKDVTTVKQTLGELVDDNREYIEWLGKQCFGTWRVGRFIKHLQEELSHVSPTGTKVTIPLIETCLGEGDCQCPECNKGEDPRKPG